MSDDFRVDADMPNTGNNNCEYRPHMSGVLCCRDTGVTPRVGVQLGCDPLRCRNGNKTRLGVAGRERERERERERIREGGDENRSS